MYIFRWVAGHDGNFFVYNYMSQKDVDAEVVKAKIPSAFKLAEDKKLPDDIEDPAAYRFVLRFFWGIIMAIKFFLKILSFFYLMNFYWISVLKTRSRKQSMIR